MKKVPTIILSVSYKGVKFIDATNKVGAKPLFGSDSRHSPEYAIRNAGTPRLHHASSLLTFFMLPAHNQSCECTRVDPLTHTERPDLFGVLS